MCAIESFSNANFLFNEYSIGKTAHQKNGGQLPTETLDGIRNADATFTLTLAVSYLSTPPVVGCLRRELKLYAYGLSKKFE
jgi:isocitrate/isopropylmalate dehydrogenase